MSLCICADSPVPSLLENTMKVSTGQGFSYLSEVGARGLLNLGKKAFG